MSDRKLFIAIHDYQHGLVAIRIWADSCAQIERLLPSPTWDVYADEDPDRPSLSDEENIDTSDIEQPSSMLEQAIFSSKMEKEGKSPFMYRVTTDTGYEYRTVWARSEQEIEERFPAFESMVGFGINSEQFKAMGTSDFDVNDAFLERFSIDR